MHLCLGGWCYINILIGAQSKAYCEELKGSVSAEGTEMLRPWHLQGPSILHGWLKSVTHVLPLRVFTLVGNYVFEILNKKADS